MTLIIKMKDLLLGLILCTVTISIYDTNKKINRLNVQVARNHQLSMNNNAQSYEMARIMKKILLENDRTKLLPKDDKMMKKFLDNTKHIRLEPVDEKN